MSRRLKKIGTAIFDIVDFINIRTLSECNEYRRNNQRNKRKS